VNWQEFKAAHPGERFKRRYSAKQKRGKRGWKRGLSILAGSILVAAGLFMLVAPGPGIVVLMVGAAMVAEESLPTARFLDWSEVRIRRAISVLRKNV
jgi:hypothetical protein